MRMIRKNQPDFQHPANYNQVIYARVNMNVYDYMKNIGLRVPDSAVKAFKRSKACRRITLVARYKGKFKMGD